MSSDSAEDVAKIVLSAGALLVCAGFSWYNSSNSDDKIRALKNGHSTIFNSVADCLASENSQSSCNTSHGIAKSDTTSLGTRLKYSFKFSCEKVHGNTCEYHYRSKGNSFYTPNMVAWQVLQDDIKIAVPLYSTLQPNEYMRTDKKIISLASIEKKNGSVPAPQGTF